LPAPVGTEVRAVQGGTVRLAKKDHDFGGYVVLEHSDPRGFLYCSIYEHLEPIKRNLLLKDKDKTAPQQENLKEGDVVQQGDVIGVLVIGSKMIAPNLRLKIRESSYEYSISISESLPEGQSCAGAPAFPERFYDPKKIVWYWGR
jgi:hypothetical protein